MVSLAGRDAFGRPGLIRLGQVRRQGYFIGPNVSFALATPAYPRTSAHPAHVAHQLAQVAKNAALPIIAAGLLCEGEHRTANVPALVDVTTLGRILRNMGVAFELKDNRVIVDSSKLNNPEAPYDLVRTMRASVLVLGPLVARFGRARVSLPGGCAIGARPVNLHIMGLEKMGAKVTIEHGYVVAEARRLKGAHIYFDTVTVTGTENLMMAASLAEGKTVLENAAREPEIVDLG